MYLFATPHTVSDTGPDYITRPSGTVTLKKMIKNDKNIRSHVGKLCNLKTVHQWVFCIKRSHRHWPQSTKATTSLDISTDRRPCTAIFHETWASSEMLKAGFKANIFKMDLVSFTRSWAMFGYPEQNSTCSFLFDDTNDRLDPLKPNLSSLSFQR